MGPSPLLWSLVFWQKSFIFFCGEFKKLPFFYKEKSVEENPALEKGERKYKLSQLKKMRKWITSWNFWQKILLYVFFGFIIFCCRTRYHSTIFPSVHEIKTVMLIIVFFYTLYFLVQRRRICPILQVLRSTTRCASFINSSKSYHYLPPPSIIIASLSLIVLAIQLNYPLIFNTTPLNW